MMFGRISCHRMRGVEQPIAFADATKSRLATCCVALRVTTAKRSHSSRPMMRIRMGKELPTTATTTRATSTTGSVRRVVIRKLTARSTRPPK